MYTTTGSCNEKGRYHTPCAEQGATEDQKLAIHHTTMKKSNDNAKDLGYCNVTMR
jgi:hypothetical protein